MCYNPKPAAIKLKWIRPKSRSTCASTGEPPRRRLAEHRTPCPREFVAARCMLATGRCGDRPYLEDVIPKTKSFLTFNSFGRGGWPSRPHNRQQRGSVPLGQRTLVSSFSANLCTRRTRVCPMRARRDPLLLRKQQRVGTGRPIGPLRPPCGESEGSLAAGALWFSNSNSCQSDNGRMRPPSARNTRKSKS
jgi:hypothetical protein